MTQDEVKALEQRASQDFKEHLKLGVFIVGILFVAVCVRYGRNKNEQDINRIDRQGAILPTGGDKGQNISKVPSYIPPEGGVTITPKDKTKTIDEVINVHYKEFGLTFEPGIHATFPQYPSLGLDAKLFFYKRYGLGVGIVGGSGLDFYYAPLVFVSRRLDDKVFFLKNTELTLDYLPGQHIPIGVGIRINL